MDIKTFLTAGILAASLAAGAKSSTPKGWIDDYDLALKRAAEENKIIVADFSGSDWCGWCKKLDKEVFATKEFRKGAKEKYILLMIDSPSDKSLLSEKAAEQNPKLVEKYDVHGFPSVLLLDAKGEVLARTGYAEGGPAKYLEKLDKIVKTVTDPDYLSTIKPLMGEIKAAQLAFEKNFEETQKAAAKKAITDNIPALRAALDKAKATTVPERLEEAKKDAIEPLEDMISGMERALKRIDGIKVDDEE